MTWTLRAEGPFGAAEATVLVKVETPTWRLRVRRGEGDGRYAEGELIEVQANPPPRRRIFAGWSGDVQHLDDPASAETRLLMPAAKVVIRAEYDPAPKLYKANVRKGEVVDPDPEARYAPGTALEIVADDPPPRRVFDGWAGDVEALTDPLSPTTTLTVPEGHVTVRATWRAEER